MCFARLGRGDDEVGLSAEECGDLDQIDDACDCVGLFGGVDVGGCGDAELLFDGAEVFEPLFDADASFGGDGGSVGFVEAGFEDVGEPGSFADGFAVFSDGHPHFERFECAWPSDDDKGVPGADRGSVNGTESIHSNRLGMSGEIGGAIGGTGSQCG